MKSMSSTLGNAVIVAIDHGLHWGVYDDFEDPEETLERLLACNPDGILASVPFIRRFEETLSSHDIYTIATLDILHDSVFPGEHRTEEIHTQVFSVEEAIRVDADAAKVALVYGRKDNDVLEENLKFVAEAAERGQEKGLPLVVEPTLWGQLAEDELDPDYLANANRIAFELGANILKSPYPGTPETFASIAENAPQPVYIAGGPASETDREVLEMVAGAVNKGAHGIMFGRKIWQREDPAPIIAALKDIVHDGASVDEAHKHL